MDCEFSGGSEPGLSHSHLNATVETSGQQVVLTGELAG